MTAQPVRFLFPGYGPEPSEAVAIEVDDERLLLTDADDNPGTSVTSAFHIAAELARRAVGAPPSTTVLQWKRNELDATGGVWHVTEGGDGHPSWRRVENMDHHLRSAMGVLGDSAAQQRLTGSVEVRPATTLGMLSHEAFEARLSEWVRLGHRYRAPFSLVLIQVRDAARGDARSLTEIASTLADAVRDVDLVCQLSQSEFAVLLPNQDTQGAITLGKRLADVARVLGPSRVAIGIAPGGGRVSDSDPLSQARVRDVITALWERATRAVERAKHSPDGVAGTTRFVPRDVRRLGEEESE